MAVVKTFVENEKTIRVWEESRGNKTLIRKFKTFRKSENWF